MVCSAHKGITDALVAAAREAAGGVLAPASVLDRQAAVARALGCDDALLGPFFAEITDLLGHLLVRSELIPRSLELRGGGFGEAAA